MIHGMIPDQLQRTILGLRMAGESPGFYYEGWLTQTVRAVLNTTAWVVCLFVLTWFLISPSQAYHAPFALKMGVPIFFVSKSLLLRHLNIVGWRKFIEVLQHHDNSICTACGYALNGLPEAYTCPECGNAYSIDKVRSYWIQWQAGK